MKKFFIDFFIGCNLKSTVQEKTVPLKSTGKIKHNFLNFFFSFSALLIINCTLTIENCSSQSWVQQSVPFTTEIFFDMKFVNANTGFISNSTPLFIKTTNAGYNWQALNDFHITSLSIIDSMYIYGAGYRAGYGKLYKSTNCGLTWDSLLTSAYNYSYINFFNRDTGIISGSDFGTWGYIWRTTDGGLTKNLITTINWSTPGILFSLKEKVNGEYFGLVHNDQLWYKTTNSGLNWQQMPNIPTTYQIGSVFFLNPDTGWATINNNYFNYVFYTTNGGYNWGTQTLPYSQPAFDIYFANPRKGWIGCGGLQKIYATSNGGNKWGVQDVTGGGAGKLFFIDSLIGWAQTSYNTLSHTTNGGGVINSIKSISENTSQNYKLFQNYPNPFNPSTNIKYQIANRSFVKLKIYDILGRDIETLVNEKQNAGTYEATFKGSQYPSGIYFYKLTTVRFSETKKMILLK